MGELLEAIVNAILTFGTHFETTSSKSETVNRVTMGCAVFALVSFVVLLLIAVLQEMLGSGRETRYS